MSQNKKLIGLSLSLCIKDIIENNVGESDIEKIISRTCARDEDGWNNVISYYQEKHWGKNPEEAKNICLRLRDAGKIEQPRLRNQPLHGIEAGHWMKN